MGGVAHAYSPAELAREVTGQAGGSHREGLHPALFGVQGPAGQLMPDPVLWEI